MELTARKPNRLRKYDYNREGAYFITICTKDRHEFFGRIVGGGVLDAPHLFTFDAPSPTTSDGLLSSASASPKMILSEIGLIADRYIHALNQTYINIAIDKYVIMPNHIHMILRVFNSGNNMMNASANGTSRTPSPTNAVVPAAISTFKRFTNKECGFSIFQRSFHDHIIRSEQEYREIGDYIDQNPLKWDEDCYYAKQGPLPGKP